MTDIEREFENRRVESRFQVVVYCCFIAAVSFVIFISMYC